MGKTSSRSRKVAAPEHLGNSQSAGDDDFDTAASHRVPDVSFVIDTLYEREALDRTQVRREDAYIGYAASRRALEAYGFSGRAR